MTFLAKGTTITNTIYYFSIILCLISCRKIPLSQDIGVFNVGVVHWFETEKIAYFFFSLEEDQKRFVNPIWQLTWIAQNTSGGEERHDEKNLDLTNGVHQHQRVLCGKNRSCASYSVRSEYPLISAHMKFLYDASHDLGVDLDFAVQNHIKTDLANAYSAIAYGVFDSNNQKVLAKVIDHFGTPIPQEVADFGLKRLFRASSPLLFEASLEQEKDVRSLTGSDYLFPAQFCASESSTSFTKSFEKEGWIEPGFSSEEEERGACFFIDFLDKNEKSIITEKPVAYARKNPILAKSEGLSLVSPLRDVIKIPIILSVCSDDPFAQDLVDESFFRYQKFVLGFDNRETDVCFRSNIIGDFATKLQRHLNDRLSEARNAAQGQQDFLFVVVLHDRFSKEFQTVSRTVSEEIFALAQAEVTNLSPRLLGGFVYSSSIFYQPNTVQRPYVLWCPQDLLSQVLNPMAALANQNCITTPALKLDLRIINFVTPLGPLPSRERYEEYIKRYRDDGLAKKPQLNFQSVPIDETTILDQDNRVTYFSGQRYAIANEEKVRVCLDEAETIAASMQIKRVGADPEKEGISLLEVNPLWLSDDAPGDYDIGISWEYPFVGQISYDSPLSGQVLGMVPYQRSFKAYEILGDAKWRANQWDFGAMVQHCRRYCDHPFFDELGVYQIHERWSDPTRSFCPKSRPPQAPDLKGSAL